MIHEWKILVSNLYTQTTLETLKLAYCDNWKHEQSPTKELQKNDDKSMV
jgi:hypothetical protein